MDENRDVVDISVIQNNDQVIVMLNIIDARATATGSRVGTGADMVVPRVTL